LRQDLSQITLGTHCHRSGQAGWGIWQLGGEQGHTQLCWLGDAALGVVALGAAEAPNPQLAPMGWGVGGVAPRGGASGCWAWLSGGPAG